MVGLPVISGGSAVRGAYTWLGRWVRALVARQLFRFEDSDSRCNVIFVPFAGLPHGVFLSTVPNGRVH